MSQYFGNDANTINALSNNFTVASDRSDILAWLSPLEPRLRHQDIRDCRVENVGEWLLETEEFENWYAGIGSGGSESDNAVLFCYVDPGVGRTFISSLVIDRLCDRAKGQNVAVACFYFDFTAQKEQSPASVLGALLKQVVSGLEEVPVEIVQAYEDQKKVIGGRGPQLADIVKMLQTTSSEKGTFICIDAMDECEPGNQVKLLHSLNQILRGSPGTRIFVTGSPQIQPGIVRRLSRRVASVSISPKRDDIIRYLYTRLDEDTNPDAMDSSLEADIMEKIPEDISEIFLLVTLNIDTVLQETTIHRRRQKLSAMTDGVGLGDAYDATLGRIKGQGGEKARLGMAALMWISHSERPLKADELCYALAVEIGSPDFDDDNVPSIGTLLVCCQGLVALDKEASTVRLIHFTLQEHLQAHPQLLGLAHSTMAETCLSYLNSRQVNALSASPSTDLRAAPFLGYSSLYWGVHAKRELSNLAKCLALKLFEDYDNHISAEILLDAWGWDRVFPDFDEPPPFSALHCASVFGIVEIVGDLLGMEGWDINQEDSVGNTPLVWAARNGHAGVAKVLLGQGNINPDKPGMLGQTPLYCAATNGHERVAEMLLGRSDINPDKPDIHGQTPLHSAAEDGHAGVVKMLLGRGDVNPNIPDNCGMTPLCRAAESGHERVVEILLRRDGVNPNKPDKFGQTPLCCAARNGHEGAVKILLELDGVNPNELDRFGQTPLFLAAWDGHEGVVKLLLGRDDVSPHKTNRASQTPLWCAAKNGHEGVVKALLGRHDVNPNEPDPDGETPLFCAARNGHEGVVKILLGRCDVNPEKRDQFGQTPLSCAAKNGHEGVVKILLGQDDVNPNKADELGQTPLLCASENGHEGVVKILLGRSDVNPEKQDQFGQTPLSCATKNGHEGVVKILLGRDGVSPDKLDKSGRIPLWCSAERGHTGAVVLLQPPEYTTLTTA